MDERIGGKQDRPSLTIDGRPRTPQIVTHKHVNCFPCCMYVPSVMKSAFVDVLVPPVPLDFK